MHSLTSGIYGSTGRPDGQRSPPPAALRLWRRTDVVVFDAFKSSKSLHAWRKGRAFDPAHMSSRRSHAATALVKFNGLNQTSTAQEGTCFWNQRIDLTDPIADQGPIGVSKKRDQIILDHNCAIGAQNPHFLRGVRVEFLLRPE